MKRTFFLLAFLIGISLSTFAQIDEEGGQFFGGSRAVQTAYSVYDFGNIQSPVSHEFIIRNTSPNPMYISYIDIPAGVSVTILNKKIEPMGQTKIIVTVDPKLFPKKGNFNLPMKVTTLQNLNNGQIIKTISVYKIKGNIQ